MVPLVPHPAIKKVKGHKTEQKQEEEYQSEQDQTTENLWKRNNIKRTDKEKNETY